MRLAMLERQSPDPEEARLRSMALLRKWVSEAEKQHGPLRPQTPEEEARMRDWLDWLRAIAEARG